MCQVELENSHNVTAVLERGALLNCRVRGIGNRTVSSKSLHLVALLCTFWMTISKAKYLIVCMRNKREQTGQHWVRKWISQETQEFNITGNVEIIFFLPTRSLLWTFVRYYFSASRCWQLKFLTLEPPASNEKGKPWFIIFWFFENFVSTNYLFGNNVAANWPAITKCTLHITGAFLTRHERNVLRFLTLLYNSCATLLFGQRWCLIESH